MIVWIQSLTLCHSRSSLIFFCKHVHFVLIPGTISLARSWQKILATMRTPKVSRIPQIFSDIARLYIIVLSPPGCRTSFKRKRRKILGIMKTRKVQSFYFILLDVISDECINTQTVMTLITAKLQVENWWTIEKRNVNKQNNKQEKK